MINKTFLLLLLGSFFFTEPKAQTGVPIIFKEYGVQIYAIEKIGDTIYLEKSANEKFKFVFYDDMGKSYCERFIKNKLFQKGNFENSLDTLKRYVSGRNNNGTTSAIRVQSFFEPLKNGIWITYKNNKQIKESYSMGLLQTQKLGR